MLYFSLYSFFILLEYILEFFSSPNEFFVLACLKNTWNGSLTFYYILDSELFSPFTSIQFDRWEFWFQCYSYSRVIDMFPFVFVKPGLLENSPGRVNIFLLLGMLFSQIFPWLALSCYSDLISNVTLSEIPSSFIDILV